MKAVAWGMAGVFLAVQAGAALAQAGCPTAEDMRRGIRVDFADGSHEVFRTQASAAGGVEIIVDGLDAEGFGYQMELGQGVHLLAYRGMTDGAADIGSEIAYDYGLLPGDLPVPVAEGQWSSQVTVTDQFGVRSEPQSHVWSGATTVDIGGCTYDMIETVIAYKTDDGYREGVEYLPALGFGYLVWNEAAGMPRMPTRPVSISVASKS